MDTRQEVEGLGQKLGALRIGGGGGGPHLLGFGLTDLVSYLSSGVS